MVDEFAILAEGAPIVATLGSPKTKSRSQRPNARRGSLYDYAKEIVVFAASDEASLSSDPSGEVPVAVPGT